VRTSDPSAWSFSGHRRVASKARKATSISSSCLATSRGLGISVAWRRSASRPGVQWCPWRLVGTRLRSSPHPSPPASWPPFWRRKRSKFQLPARSVLRSGRRCRDGPLQRVPTAYVVDRVVICSPSTARTSRVRGWTVYRHQSRGEILVRDARFSRRIVRIESDADSVEQPPTMTQPEDDDAHICPRIDDHLSSHLHQRASNLVFSPSCSCEGCSTESHCHCQRMTPTRIACGRGQQHDWRIDD
jgi:hypothetical protein